MSRSTVEQDVTQALEGALRQLAAEGASRQALLIGVCRLAARLAADAGMAEADMLGEVRGAWAFCRQPRAARPPVVPAAQEQESPEPARGRGPGQEQETAYARSGYRKRFG